MEEEEAAGPSAEDCLEDPAPPPPSSQDDLGLSLALARKLLRFVFLSPPEWWCSLPEEPEFLRKYSENGLDSRLFLRNSLNFCDGEVERWTDGEAAPPPAPPVSGPGDTGDGGPEVAGLPQLPPLDAPLATPPPAAPPPPAGHQGSSTERKEPEWSSLVQLACFSSFFSFLRLRRALKLSGEVARVTRAPSEAEEEMGMEEEGAGTERRTEVEAAGEAESEGAGEREQLELPPERLRLSRRARRQSTACAVTGEGPPPPTPASPLVEPPLVDPPLASRGVGRCRGEAPRVWLDVAAAVEVAAVAAAGGAAISHEIDPLEDPHGEIICCCCMDFLRRSLASRWGMVDIARCRGGGLKTTFLSSLLPEPFIQPLLAVIFRP